MSAIENLVFAEMTHRHHLIGGGGFAALNGLVEGGWKFTTPAFVRYAAAAAAAGYSTAGEEALWDEIEASA